MITAEEKEKLISQIQQLHKITYEYETYPIYKDGYNQALLDVTKLFESVNTDTLQAEERDTE